MELIVKPGCTDGTAIRVCVNSIANLFIFVPKAFIFATILPFHYAKTVDLIVNILTFVILMIFRPEVVAKAIDVVMLPLTFICCAIPPFFCAKTSFGTCNKISLEIVAFLILLLTKPMFFVKFEVTNIKVSITINQFSFAIGTTKRKIPLIFYTILHFKFPMTMRAAKLPLSCERCSIFKYHRAMTVSKASKPLTAIGRLCLFVVMTSSFECVIF